MPIQNALSGFAEAIRNSWGLSSISAQPEDQLKSPTQILLDAVGTSLGFSIQSKTEVHPANEDINGRPDIGVAVNKLLCGHVEL